MYFRWALGKFPHFLALFVLKLESLSWSRGTRSRAQKCPRTEKSSRERGASRGPQSIALFLQTSRGKRKQHRQHGAKFLKCFLTLEATNDSSSSMGSFSLPRRPVMSEDGRYCLCCELCNSDFWAARQSSLIRGQRVRPWNTHVVHAKR